MKRIIGIVIVVILIVNCSKNKEKSILSPEEPLPQEFYYSLNGELLDGQNLTPVDSAIITIDTLSIMSDSLGAFTFTNLKNGVHNINVTHQYYDSLNVIVELNSDTTLILNMHPIMGDYWPMAIGNSWHYSISRFFQAELYGERIYGKMVIRVISRVEQENEIKYDFSSELQYTYKYLGGTPWDDDITTKVDKTIGFIINKNNEGRLFLEDSSNDRVMKFLSDIFTNIEIKKEYPICLGDTILIERIPFESKYSVVLILNKGVKTFYYKDPLAWSSWGYFRMTLDSILVAQ